MPITHAFTSAKADGGDATLIRPSDWNADHEGADVLLVATALLSSAQILALHTTPVEITTAPASGKMQVPVQVIFRTIPATVAYEVPSPLYIYVTTIQEYNVESNGGSWGYATRNPFIFGGPPYEAGIPCSVLFIPDDDVSTPGGNGHALALVANSAITVGDGALHVTTLYIEVDVS